eukprot:TRINITY_DN575_c0_g2_i2.p1 TRINITY_DN575_c0_g2~~TRINITY_DN575_c0_g2_i2.p1  ORF type:complete len:410 (-),score=78.42 TRINITY_DN575_c0_g2_i2:483-1712(-)
MLRCPWSSSLSSSWLQNPKVSSNASRTNHHVRLIKDPRQWSRSSRNLSTEVHQDRKEIDHTFSVAPLHEWTDRYFRYFCRLMTKRTLLYTEMTIDRFITLGEEQKVRAALEFEKEEHPIVFQMAGLNPQYMGPAAAIVSRYGYDEININCGCPSTRANAGGFGIEMMKDPKRTAECIAAIKQNTHVPVTVKCRLGYDNHDTYDELKAFIETCANVGVNRFIIHSRKAISNISPRKNRSVPPIDYEPAKKLKSDFPSLNFVINGEITTLDQIKGFIADGFGVMTGRLIMDDPWKLMDIDHEIFGEPKNTTTRSEILEKYIAYLMSHIQPGMQYNTHQMVRPILQVTHRNWEQRWRNAPLPDVLKEISPFTNITEPLPSQEFHRLVNDITSSHYIRLDKQKRRAAKIPNKF